MRRKLVACVLAAAALSSCGSDASTTKAAPAAAASSAAATGGQTNGTDPATGLSNDVPDVAVVDVNTGSTSSLRTLISGDKPVLLWFWAPH